MYELPKSYRIVLRLVEGLSRMLLGYDWWNIVARERSMDWMPALVRCLLQGSDEMVTIWTNWLWSSKGWLRLGSPVDELTTLCPLYLLRLQTTFYPVCSIRLNIS